MLSSKMDTYEVRWDLDGGGGFIDDGALLPGRAAGARWPRHFRGRVRLATAWVVRRITLFAPHKVGLAWGSSSPRIFTNRPKDSEFNWPGRGECERR